MGFLKAKRLLIRNMPCSSFAMTLFASLDLSHQPRPFFPRPQLSSSTFGLFTQPRFFPRPIPYEQTRLWRKWCSYIIDRIPWGSFKKGNELSVIANWLSRLEHHHPPSVMVSVLRIFQPTSSGPDRSPSSWAAMINVFHAFTTLKVSNGPDLRRVFIAVEIVDFSLSYGQRMVIASGSRDVETLLPDWEHGAGREGTLFAHFLPRSLFPASLRFPKSIRKPEVRLSGIPVISPREIECFQAH